MTSKLAFFVAFPLFIVAATATSVRADSSPFSIAFFPFFEVPSRDSDIAGARLSIFWGEHKNVSGLDLGTLGNFTEGEFTGTALGGFFNVTDRAQIYGAQLTNGVNYSKTSLSVYGVQMAGIVNYSAGKSDVHGLQFSMANFVSRLEGVQVGLLNKVEDITGLQVGLYNRVEKAMGLQLGLFNHTEKARGLQMGLVNIANSLEGIQLGLINIHSQGAVPFFPFVNMSL